MDENNLEQNPAPMPDLTPAPDSAPEQVPTPEPISTPEPESTPEPDVQSTEQPAVEVAQPEVAPVAETIPAKNSTPSEKPAKKDNKMTLILLGVIVAIAAVMGLVLILSSSESKKTSATTTTTTTTTTVADDEEDAEPDKSDADVAAQKINDEIKTDVESVVTAISNYQANNRGAIPTIEISTGKETEEEKTKTWQYFIDNYLNADHYGAATGFTDTYKVEICNFYEGTCKKMADLTWSNNKYTIFIATRAVCSTNGGLEASNGTRHVAVYTIKKPYSTMTNKFICANNQSVVFL